jgi:hypothetical protein
MLGIYQYALLSTGRLEHFSDGHCGRHESALAIKLDTYGNQASVKLVAVSALNQSHLHFNPLCDAQNPKMPTKIPCKGTTFLVTLWRTVRDGPALMNRARSAEPRRASHEPPRPSAGESTFGAWTLVS